MRPIPRAVVLLRRAGALAAASLLILLLAASGAPSVWHGPAAALAAQGGNGKGSNGNGKGNGGPNGDQGAAAGGSAATPASDKAKSKAKDKDQDESDSAAASDQGDAAESDGGDAAAAGEPASEEATAVDAGVPPGMRRARAAQAAGEPGRGGRDFVADEVVVADLRADVRAAITRLGFVVLDEHRLASLGLTITRLRVPRAMTAPAARRLLMQRHPDIQIALNALYRPEGQVVLPPRDYAAKLIGWGPVSVDCGRGLRIGALDTGVATAMPGLRGADIVERSFLPAGAKTASPEHGSAVAWLLVGRSSRGGTGLLPGAQLLVANVFMTQPDGATAADVVALVTGMDWLLLRNVTVINMSFAGKGNAVVDLALQRALARGAIVVAAAGNDGPAAPPAFPAAEPGVIAVTAVDSHARPYEDANRGDYIDFAAPGVRVWTPGPGATGSYRTGTSFAAPFVTAAVAARLAGGAKPDPARIAAVLAETALDLGEPGRDPVFGSGLIQSASPCSALTQ
jgi:hypothetical protein